MRRIFIIIILLLAFLNFKNLSPESIYEGNNWGEIIYIDKEVEMYLYSDSDLSIYRLKEDKYIYCSLNGEVNNRIFCWYIFDADEIPISGWVDSKNLEK